MDVIDQICRRSPDLLTATDEARLAAAIEAGLYAAECLDHGHYPQRATPAELHELVRRGERARDRLVLANVRLVARLARREATRSAEEASELFAEGLLGLFEAVQRFDHRRNLRFSTYAVPWIRTHVRAAARSPHLTRYWAGRLAEVRAASAALTQQLGRMPTDEEVAQRVGRPRAWVEELLNRSMPAELDRPDGGEVQLRDDTAQREFDRVLESGARVDLLAELSGLDRVVIELRYGFGGPVCSQAEAARRLGISAGRVRRAEERALDRLRGVCTRPEPIAA
ncbi:sigma-70 family RNA polymerase sigma factor [Granulicoccus phenolivorans]|uniref:sigma-70 family RNA polymerase sigma factor n=1 Tax=Granulicoccus phenolivorans TaxID=266854 RepID=UPI00047C0188|nr:sigma-70 family RNA polymerase sigma factor [Granulicoccus phenolivorans]